jgi:hypothetical protein
VRADSIRDYTEVGTVKAIGPLVPRKRALTSPGLYGVSPTVPRRIARDRNARLRWRRSPCVTGEPERLGRATAHEASPSARHAAPMGRCRRRAARSRPSAPPRWARDWASRSTRSLQREDGLSRPGPPRTTLTRPRESPPLVTSSKPPIPDAILSDDSGRRAGRRVFAATTRTRLTCLVAPRASGAMAGLASLGAWPAGFGVERIIRPRWARRGGMRRDAST